jgi:hypothetical protein
MPQPPALPRLGALPARKYTQPNKQQVESNPLKTLTVQQQAAQPAAAIVPKMWNLKK